MNYFTILPYTKKELALIPFPTSDLPRGSHDAPTPRIECSSPHAQARLNGLSSRRQSERIPKASRRHPEGKANAERAEPSSSAAWKWQHAITNNQKPPSKKELKHKQQKIKRFYWSNEAKCVTLQPTTSTPHL